MNKEKNPCLPATDEHFCYWNFGKQQQQKNRINIEYVKQSFQAPMVFLFSISFNRSIYHNCISFQESFQWNGFGFFFLFYFYFIFIEGSFSPFKFVLIQILIFNCTYKYITIRITSITNDLMKLKQEHNIKKKKK